jgi:phosphoribosylglycinamide formyltransferase 1
MLSPSQKIRLAVFASGSGTNTESILEHFKNNDRIDVSLIVTNKSDAGVIARAEKNKVEWVYIPKSEFDDQELVEVILDEHKVDWIILAGWLLLVPPYLIKRYSNRIINIHPALLPRHGGKGMYGRFVHETVKLAGDKESGITIHLVNEKFDEGKILAQYKVGLNSSDTAASIEQKVRQLELKYFATDIEKILLSRRG